MDRPKGSLKERFVVGGSNPCPKKCGDLAVAVWGNHLRWTCPRCGERVFTDHQGWLSDIREVLKEAQEWGEA